MFIPYTDELAMSVYTGVVTYLNILAFSIGLCLASCDIALIGQMKDVRIKNVSLVTGSPFSLVDRVSGLEIYRR